MDSNKSTFLYCQSHDNEVIELCSPLKNYLNIENFGYLKVFKNSQYIKLSNNLELSKDFFQNVKSGSIFCKEPFYNDGMDENTHYFLWPDKPENAAMNFYLKHDCWNGCNIVKLHDQYIEIWYFATKKENNTIQNFYKKNINILVNFANYFEYKMKDVMQQNAPPFASFREGFDFSLPSALQFSSHEQKNIDEFLKHIYPKGLYVKSRNGIIKLTYMEIRCLMLLAKSNSIKEIATKLGISSRTAEQHLVHIKHKSGHNLKSDLANIFFEQVEHLLPSKR